MRETLKSILTPLASLRLTVVLLVLCMLLIYAGTWAQVDAGVWHVQKRYFHSLFVWIPFQVFFPRPKVGQAGIPGGFPMLGGYLLGLLLLINLIAAHGVRFKLSWKRSGVILIHLGLILLLVGEGITSSMAVESQMTIEEGSSSSYSQDIREVELAIVDPSSSKQDEVWAIPASRLREGTSISDPSLPVSVKIESYYPNSSLLGPMQAGAKKDARATAGSGVGLTVVPRALTAGTDADAVDAPSAYVTLTSNGQSIGTYLASLFIDRPQEFNANGKTYLLSLRFKRIYHPFTVHLYDFRHDKYPGTNIPKDFSSLIRLVDSRHDVDREVRVWMNNPLRHAGYTFFQSGFKPGDTATILQIVKNPGWTLPYVACAIGALGLLIHFGIRLIMFLIKRMDQAAIALSTPTKPAKDEAASTVLPTLTALGIVVGVYLLALGYVFRPVGPKTEFDLKTFSTLPVQHDGRIQPLDSLARNSLKMLAGRESAVVNGQRLGPVRVLADMIAQPEKAVTYPIIRIDHPQVIGMLNLDPKQKRYSLRQILDARDKLQEQWERARAVEPKQRDLFQNKVMELAEKIRLYMDLGQMESLRLIPPGEKGEDWQPLGQVAHGGIANASGAGKTYLNLVDAYHDHQPAKFNEEVRVYAQSINEKLPAEQSKVRFEALFNRFDPFTQSIVLNLVGFMLACLSWMFWGPPLRRAAIFACILALVLHTGGLLARMYITGRPPVISNLASTAIFIGWGAVVLSIILELIFRNGLGSATATMMGFISLLIANRLSLAGDTLKVLQAVLDTNFWLATHVVIITLGYSATFLAGFLGILYVFQAIFSPNFTKEDSKELARMIYGVTCFAVLFSFVGTILGGIWADQSWGRFWGWDPKENGAVLIVLANALVLHARWGGLVRERGIACLAIFGNIVTSWSWFGTNMLGVGLHSYGFMDAALMWLLVFVASQIAIIGVANLPMTWWRSALATKSGRGFAVEPATAAGVGTGAAAGTRAVARG